MHQFTSRHAEFDDFSDFFAREVLPKLHERDEARAKAVRNGIIAAIVTCLVISGAGIVVLLWLAHLPYALVLMGLSVIATFIIFGVVTDDIREETKGRIANAIVGYIGWQFDPDVRTYDVGDFKDLFLLPEKIDRMSFEDSLSGTAHGASFRSVEAKLERESRDSKGNRSWDTVFQGQLMRLDFPTKTFGRTIVLRDKGWFNAKKKSDMKRIGLVDPVFEKIFEAYGTDQVEGRVILDPALMQRMVDLERAVSGKNIRFGFDRDTLFIAVETKDQFEAGSMFKSLTSPDRTQKILDEVGTIFDIVDTLLKRKKSGSLPY